MTITLRTSACAYFAELILEAVLPGYTMDVVTLSEPLTDEEEDRQNERLSHPFLCPCFFVFVAEGKCAEAVFTQRE